MKQQRQNKISVSPLIRPSEIRSILRELRVHPSKALGQNFLADANVLAIIHDIIGARSDDEILEIGPGLGALTEHMAKIARRVVAVEKDRRLYEWLKTRFNERTNTEIIHDDVLNIQPETLMHSGINKLVSNLPYSTGSAILVNFLRAEHPPDRMILTMQLEVAKRLTAFPGDADFGLLSLWRGLSYDAKIRKVISPKCFYPAPGVKSAVIHLARHAESSIKPNVKKIFFELTKFAFSQRRKQLKTLFRNPDPRLSMSASRILALFKEHEINTSARPETLSSDDWLAIAEQLAATD